MTNKLKRNFHAAILMALLIWPALLTYIFHHSDDDTVGLIVKKILYYPAWLRNLNDYWLLSEPFWKTIYINAWYINGYLLFFYYVAYMFTNPKYLNQLREYSMIKLIALSIFGFSACVLWNVNILYLPSASVNSKFISFIRNDILYILLFATQWAIVLIGFFAGSVMFLVEIFRRIYNSGDKNG